MPKIKVEEKIKYFLPNNYYKKEITCSSLTSTPFFFAERKPRCNIVACAQCIVCRVSGWPFQQQQKKLATTDYHHQQHQHLSPNHFVVALPQRHLEHRSPRRSIQLARNQAKRWRHSTKSIFTLLLPHPFQLPGVIMWGLSSYCCVIHRRYTAEQRLIVYIVYYTDNQNLRRYVCTTSTCNDPTHLSSML